MGEREIVLTCLLTWPAGVHHDVVLICVRVLGPTVRAVTCLSRLQECITILSFYTVCTARLAMPTSTLERGGQYCAKDVAVMPAQKGRLSSSHTSAYSTVPR